jgi:hypothetical protein
VPEPSRRQSVAKIIFDDVGDDHVVCDRPHIVGIHANPVPIPPNSVVEDEVAAGCLLDEYPFLGIVLRRGVVGAVQWSRSCVCACVGKCNVRVACNWLRAITQTFLNSRQNVETAKVINIGASTSCCQAKSKSLACNNTNNNNSKRTDPKQQQQKDGPQTTTATGRTPNKTNQNKPKQRTDPKQQQTKTKDGPPKQQHQQKRQTPKQQKC